MSRSSGQQIDGCWLVTDLDGTLVPTPHAANGRYATLGEEYSPGDQQQPRHSHNTLPHLREWILNGGNVVVITTADFRVLHQVYLPLRDTLLERNKMMAEKTNSTGGGVVAGQLLISAFSGAAMFYCSPTFLEPSVAQVVRNPKTALGFEIVSSRSSGSNSSSPTTKLPTVHQLLRNEIVLIPNYIQLNHTAMGKSIAEKGLGLLKDLFFGYAMEILLVDDSSLETLSGRYRKLWRALVCRLLWGDDTDNGSQKSSGSSADGKSTASGKSQNSSATAASGAQDSAGRPMKKRERALAVLSDLTSNGQDAKLIEFERKFKKNGRKASFIDVVPFPQRREALEKLKLDWSLLSAMVSARIVTEKDPSGTRKTKHVVQLLLVGVPMKKSQDYLRLHSARVQRLGLRALAQPNSVVMAVDEVTKGTAVRFLSSNHQTLLHRQQSSAQASDVSTSATIDDIVLPTSSPSVPRVPGSQFAGSMQLARAVALGDTPQSGDKHLTQFPPMHFISLQKDRDAFSLGLLVRAVTQRHIFHVGLEQVGGTAFLQHLTRLLLQHQERQSSGHGGGGSTKTMEMKSTTSSAAVVSNEEFHRCVHDAANSAAYAIRGPAGGGTRLSHL